MRSPHLAAAFILYVGLLGCAGCAQIQGEDEGLAGARGDSPDAVTPPGATGGGATTSPGTKPPNATVAEVAVTDGHISSGFDPLVCLDLPRDPNTNVGTVVQLYSCNGTLTQRIYTTTAQQLTNAITNACLRGNVASNAKSGTLAMGSCNPNDANQKWQFGGNAWVHVGSGLCLDLIGGQTANYVQVKLAPCASSVTQTWNYVHPYNAPAKDPLSDATTLAGRCRPRLYIFSQLDATADAEFKKVVPDVEAAVRTAIAQDCNLLYADPEDVQDNRYTLRINVTADSNAQVVPAAGKDLTLPAGYFVQMAKAGSPSLASGLLNVSIASYYMPQGLHPVWMTQGLWWYTRIRGSGLPSSYKIKGENYSAGGVTAGYFMLYLEQTYPGLVHNLVHDMVVAKAQLDDSWFQVATRLPLSKLWANYLASF